MGNPWLGIPLSDYEGHMSSAGVQQLSALSDLFAEAIALRRPTSVAVLGIAGGNGLWQEGFIGDIDELVVDRDHRGKGIGGQLLASLEMLAKKKGCRRVELDSAFHREGAHNFYEQHGFENRAYVFSKVLEQAVIPE